MTPNDRLRQLRQKRNYASAADAAEAIGVNRFTYTQHENGTRPISRQAAERYARFFRVTVDWLFFGRGSPDGAGQMIPIMGVVVAGSTIEASRSARC